MSRLVPALNSVVPKAMVWTGFALAGAGVEWATGWDHNISQTMWDVFWAMFALYWLERFWPWGSD